MKKLSSLLLAGLLVCATSARAVLVSMTDTPGGTEGTIFDNDPNGLTRTLTFDSTISSITDVRVRLNITGGYDGDLYAYLTHDGATAILLNRIGTTGAGTFGSTQVGMSVWLTNTAPDVHTAGTLTSGGHYSADGRNADPNDLAAVNAASHTDRPLTGFNTQGSFGNWMLFISDVDGGGGDATLDSWQLEMEGVPEPVNMALGIFGGFFVVVQGVRYWKMKKLISPGGVL